MDEIYVPILTASYRRRVDKIQLHLTLQTAVAAETCSAVRRLRNKNNHFSRNSVRVRRQLSATG